MGTTKKTVDGTADDAKRRDAEHMLRIDFGIRSAFVRVPALARVLGLAQPTIYASMREGRFFLPHRLLNSSPAVRFEDLLDWYCEDESARPQAFGGGRARAASSRAGGRPRSATLSRAEVDEIVARSMERSAAPPLNADHRQRR